MDYRVIDADSHLNEPDIWQERVPAAFKDRAPKMIDLENGVKAWSFDGGKRVQQIQLTATAGLEVTDYDQRGHPYHRIRRASYDPHARLEEMELDMLQAQVLYPSVALTGAHTYGNDPELQLACVQTYNDWLLDEFCSVAPDRLVGLALAPMTGVEDLLLEMKRTAEKGARGIIISTYPNGGPTPTPEDDRFWAEAQDWEYPLHIHFGFFGGTPPSGASGQAGPTPTRGADYMVGAFTSRLGMHVFKPLADIVYGGLFERFPRLKVVAVETGIGWIPYYLDSLDDIFLRHRFHTSTHLKRMPSEYFREHIWATFITDPHGIENRHAIGIDRIMWSTDYPHSQTDWPHSMRTVAHEMRYVPEDEKRRIMCDNAAELYRLNGS